MVFFRSSLLPLHYWSMVEAWVIFTLSALECGFFYMLCCGLLTRSVWPRNEVEQLHSSGSVPLGRATLTWALRSCALRGNYVSAPDIHFKWCDQPWFFNKPKVRRIIIKLWSKDDGYDQTTSSVPGRKITRLLWEQLLTFYLFIHNFVHKKTP